MRNRIRRLGHVIAVTALFVVAVGAQPAPAAPVIALPNCQGKLEVRPTQVLFACGDGNFSAEKLHWTSWGGPKAVANGVAQSNDCTPNCAAGKFHRYRIRVIVSGRQACPGGRPAYSTVTFAWPGANPGGKPYPMTYSCTSR